MSRLRDYFRTSTVAGFEIKCKQYITALSAVWLTFRASQVSEMRRLSWVFFPFFYFLLFKTSSSSKTPVTTCCPPGSFLVIEDSQQSRQLPNGLWVASDTITPTGSMLALHGWWWGAYEKYGRHNYNLKVSCEPDKNNLPPIDGFQGSSHPNPPYLSSTTR